MSQLEFDLMGVGYAAGFGRALTAFAQRPIRVLVTRRGGHLYSGLACGTESTEVAMLPATMTSWTDVVRPRLFEHFAALSRPAAGDAAAALTRARSLFAECIALHHAMLLPARQAIADFVSFTRGVVEDGDRVALDAVTEVGTPMFRAAERLVGVGLPESLDGRHLIRLAAGGACDGDGYGLAQPGWLEDADYPRRARGLLLRLGVVPAVLQVRQSAAMERRTRAVEILTRRAPVGRRGELDVFLAAAQAGAALAEVHGPTMHVRYVHELRRLALAHGVGLAEAGLLDDPHDVVHLALAELDHRSQGVSAVRDRKARYQRQMRAPLPPEERRSDDTTVRALPSTVAAQMAGLGGVLGERVGDRAWRGVAAAGGTAQGTLRVLRTQADLDRVEASDVALVPDAGPAWGWLALAGVPVVVAHGGPLSHAPALARECGTPCVVAGPGLTGLVGEGTVVKVSGDTGEVTW